MEVSHSPINLATILTNLNSQLDPLAQQLISSSQDMSLEYNQRFYELPDNPLEHKPEWHEWGIITHTLKFLEYHDSVVSDYFSVWNLKPVIDSHFEHGIDGVSKAELIRIAILLHDLGKFTMRTRRPNRQGMPTYYFIDHEKDSGRIVRTMLQDSLKEQGLTEAQIEYIARCAELHFELGIVRNEAKRRGAFDVDFATSPAAHAAYRRIIEQYPDLAIEIGVLYLGDSLAKVEIHPPGDARPYTEAELQTEIKQRNLRPELIHSARQLPTNLAVAREYLSVALKFNHNL